MLAAQFWGNGDLRSIRKVLGLSILLALTGALFFVVPALVSPQSVMRIFTTSHDSVELGSKYLKIAVLTYPFLAMTNVYVAILRAVNKVIFPVISSCIAIVINICLNYVLIFGKLGMPAMGVSGAAVATLIARIIEIVLILGYVYGKRLPVACGLKDLFGWSRLFVSRFFGTSAPVIAMSSCGGVAPPCILWHTGAWGTRQWRPSPFGHRPIQDILVVLFPGPERGHCRYPGQ